MLFEATEVGLSCAIKDLLDVYSEIVVVAQALMSSTAKVGQLQDAASRLFPLSIDLNSQSLEALEKELTDFKRAEKAAAQGAKYAEAQALAAKHAKRTQQVCECRKFKSECLDPLKVCCNELVAGFVQLNERAKQAEIAQKTILTRSKEYNMVASVLAQELDKTCLLAKSELAWLKTRELSGLKDTGSSASQEIMQNVKESTLLVTSLMQPRENGSKNRFLSRVRSAAKRECEP
jgi:hypothetical protein